MKFKICTKSGEIERRTDGVDTILTKFEFSELDHEQYHAHLDQDTKCWKGKSK